MKTSGVAGTGNQLQFHYAKGLKLQSGVDELSEEKTVLNRARDSCSNSSAVTAWALIASDDARSEQSQTMVCRQFQPALSFITAIKMEGKKLCSRFRSATSALKVDKQKDASP